MLGNDLGVVEVVGQHEGERHQPPQILAVLLVGDGERADVGEAARDQIAEDLGLTPATVRNHLRNLYEKLGVHGRDALVTLLAKP